MRDFSGIRAAAIEGDYEEPESGAPRGFEAFVRAKDAAGGSAARSRAEDYAEYRAFIRERREIAASTRGRMVKRLGGCIAIGAACVPLLIVPEARAAAFLTFVMAGVYGMFALLELWGSNTELQMLETPSTLEAPIA